MPNVTWFPLQMPPQTNMMVAFVLVKSYYICSAVIVNKKVTLFAFQSGIAKKKATACGCCDDAQQLGQMN